MDRITMRKVQETKLSEVFTLYLASAAARGVKDKTLRTYEQHFNAFSKRLDVDGNISLITSKDRDRGMHLLSKAHRVLVDQIIGLSLVEDLEQHTPALGHTGVGLSLSPKAFEKLLHMHGFDIVQLHPGLHMTMIVLRNVWDWAG